MATEKKKSTIYRYLLIIVVVIAGILVWQFYKYKIANHVISKAVNEKSKGLYSIQYDHLEIDELAGTIHVKNVRVVADTSVYQQMVNEKINPPLLFNLTIPELDIIGVKTPKALLSKQIEGNKLEISDPVIEIEIGSFLKDSTEYSPARELYKQILGKLLQIKIDSLQINRASVAVRQMKSSTNIFKANNISFQLADLLVDSTSAEDKSRIFFAKEFKVFCDELVLPSKNGKYQFQVEKLGFNSHDNSLDIAAFKIIPRLGEEKFAASFATQNDRYDFNLEGIHLSDIDRESLWHKRLSAENMVVKNSVFKIYRDLSYPRDTLSRLGKYPQQLLMKVPLPLFIKKIAFENSFIQYKEKNAKSDSAGKVQFYHVQGILSNVTNMSGAIAKNNQCILNFRAKFLDKAPVEAKLTMLLKSPKGNFFIEGNIGSISAKDLNPLTKPMGLAQMDDGKIENLHFKFSGDDSTSEGDIFMRYGNIKIALLKKDNEKNKYDKKGLVSLAANLIIKKSNPGKDGKTRVSHVKFKRIMNKSFFNLIWKTIFTGIKESVGI